LYFIIGVLLALKSQMLLFMIFAGASMVCAVLTYTVGNALLAFLLGVLALILAVVAFSTKYYMYLYIPAMRMKNKNIAISSAEPYLLSPSGTSIITSDENGTYASSFITIPIYKSGTEMSDQERLDIARLFSRILTVSKNTIKISSQLYIVNKDKYIAKIRNKLDESESKLRSVLQQAGSGTQITDRAKGEVTMWHNLLNNISASKSEALITYAMVSASGGNEEEASSIAYQHAEEVASGISAILGISAYVADGEEILNFIEPDRMIPVETVNELIHQKTVEEGI
jgi:hypothetical protein